MGRRKATSSNNISNSKDMLDRINSFYEASEATPQIKVVVIGESGAGKSNLISKLVEDRFDPRSKSTIGIDFSRYEYRPGDGLDGGDDEQSYKIQIWDTAGQERYRSSMTSIFYRDVAGVLLVFDLSKREHYQVLPRWLEEIHANCLDPEPIPIVLVGNKSDQPLSAREVSTHEGMAFARRHCLADYVETSAKVGTNVEHAFRVLFQTIIFGHPSPSPVLKKKKKDKKRSEVKYMNQRSDSIRLGHRAAALSRQCSTKHKAKSSCSC